MLISAIVFLALGLYQASTFLVALLFASGFGADIAAAWQLSRKTGAKMPVTIASVALPAALYRFGAYVVGWWISGLAS